MPIRWGGKWVHLAYIWIVSHLSAKNYQNWCKFHEVLTKTNLLSFLGTRCTSQNTPMIRESHGKTEVGLLKLNLHCSLFFWTSYSQITTQPIAFSKTYALFLAVRGCLAVSTMGYMPFWQHAKSLSLLKLLDNTTASCSTTFIVGLISSCCAICRRGFLPDRTSSFICCRQFSNGKPEQLSKMTMVTV